MPRTDGLEDAGDAGGEVPLSWMARAMRQSNTLNIVTKETSLWMRKKVILEQLCHFLFYALYGIVLLVIDERTNGCKDSECI